MVEAIKKIVLRLFPELKGAYHLPRFARVVAVNDAPEDGAICDEFRPRFSVDVEVLTPQGVPDESMPVFRDVALPLVGPGLEKGFYMFPESGTWVVLNFAYGLPHKPFISQVLPHDQSLPGVGKHDSVWAHSPGVEQRADENGNWKRETFGTITDKSLHRQIETDTAREELRYSTRNVAEHCYERVLGLKQIIGLGALKLLSGGTANLSAADNLNLTAGADCNQVAARDLKATAGNAYELKCAVATLQAQSFSIGNGSADLLAIVSDLAGVVEQLATTVATHQHSNAGAAPPSTASNHTTQAADALALGVEVDSLRGA